MKERKACWSEDPREDAGSEIEKMHVQRKKASLFSYFTSSNVSPYMFNATSYFHYYWLFTILRIFLFLKDNFICNFFKKIYIFLGL